MDKTKRPEILKGETIRASAGCGNVYITINKDNDGKIIEVFSTIGKAGACSSAISESICRMISLSLAYNVPIPEIVKQLKGIRCPSPKWHNGEQNLSCLDTIAKVLESASKSE